MLPQIIRQPGFRRLDNSFIILTVMASGLWAPCLHLGNGNLMLTNSWCESATPLGALNRWYDLNPNERGNLSAVNDAAVLVVGVDPFSIAPTLEPFLFGDINAPSVYREPEPVVEPTPVQPVVSDFTPIEPATTVAVDPRTVEATDENLLALGRQSHILIILRDKLRVLEEEYDAQQKAYAKLVEGFSTFKQFPQQSEQ